MRNIDITWKKGTLKSNPQLYTQDKVDSFFNDYSTKTFLNSSEKLKYINTWYKLFSVLDHSNSKTIKSIIDNDLKSQISNQQLETPHSQSLKCDSSITKGTIDLTVLFYEGPIARAYLETMYSLGIKPKKIIHLVSSVNLQTKKPLPTWLPQKVQSVYGEWLQRGMMHYWAKNIKKKHPELVHSIADAVSNSLNFRHEAISSITSLKPLSHYSDLIVPVNIKSFSDSSLFNILSCEKGAILYTGGGIMPAQLLSIPNVKFIHVHPGFLPNIRGSDGVLWSMLTHGRLSSSGFYMSPGIDEGAVILPCWLPSVKVKTDFSKYDHQTCYRAIYSFLDPWVRSYTLRQILLMDSDYYNMPCNQQDNKNGSTFYFMHPELCKIAFKMLN
jgi:hypothetical protein